MQTVERPVETSGEPLRKTNRYLVIALSFIVVLVAGFGAWLVIDEYTGVDREIEVLVSDWYDAWDRGDGEAVVGMMSSFARHYDQTTLTEGLKGDQLAALVTTMTAYDFTMLGEPLIIEKEVTGSYVVAVGGQISWNQGISVFRIRPMEGEWKILYHRWLD